MCDCGINIGDIVYFDEIKSLDRGKNNTHKNLANQNNNIFKVIHKIKDSLLRDKCMLTVKQGDFVIDSYCCRFVKNLRRSEIQNNYHV